MIWAKANKYKKSIDFYLEQSLKKYFDFIQNELLSKGFKNITIMSVTLPTISNNKEFKGEISTLRKVIESSQLERTKLTLEYNSRLKQFCNKHFIKFLDLESIMLGEDGLIKKEYLNDNPLDHHNNHKTYSEAIIKTLNYNHIQ